jgi:hypothetical protein
MQLSLPNYLNLIQQNLISLGVDYQVIFSAAASSAMLISHDIVCTYAAVSKRKNPPIPILVTNKVNETLTESYTCFKFNTSDININTLNKVIHSGIFQQYNIQIVEYNSSVNLEINLSLKI